MGQILKIYPITCFCASTAFKSPLDQKALLNLQTQSPQDIEPVVGDQWISTYQQLSPPETLDNAFRNLGQNQSIFGRFDLVLYQISQFLKLTNGFSPFQLHQLPVIAHFSPRDAVVGH